MKKIMVIPMLLPMLVAALLLPSSGFTGVGDIPDSKILGTEKAQIIERESYAKALTSKFLDSGLDVWVTAVGKKKTTLKMSTRLVGNVFVHKIINNDSLISQMKGKGFKKILFDDRDGFTYPHKLE